MRAILTAALLLAAAIGMARADQPAHPPADQPSEPAPRPRTCMAPDMLEAHLAAEFKETLIGRGIAGDGALLLIFASRDGASWMIAKVTANPRLACVMDFGTELQIQPGGDGI